MADNESLVWGIIRNIRDRKNKKRMLSNISTENENNKNIVKYQPSQIEAFFSASDPIGNVVISGDNIELRSRAIIGFIDSLRNKNQSVILLHSGNTILENKIQQHFRNAILFNSQTSIYEPFIGLSNSEIIRLIQTSATKLTEIHNGGQYYLEGMLDFIRSKNLPPYCDMMMNCPHLELFDKIDAAESTGKLNAQLSQKIKTYLVQGQGQRIDIENYFNVLKHQGQGLFANKLTISKSKSLRSVVSQKGLGVVNVGNGLNDVLINLILCDAFGALNNGYKLTLIIDNLSISSCDQLTQLIKSMPSSVSLALSSDDLYSSLNADDNLFATVVGKSIKKVIFHHGSGISCTKWADVFGYYEKQEVSNTYTSGNNYQSMFTVVPGQMNTSSINVNSKREYIIKPEEIAHMNQNEVFIHDAVSNELAFTTVI